MLKWHESSWVHENSKAWNIEFRCAKNEGTKAHKGENSRVCTLTMAL